MTGNQSDPPVNPSLRTRTQSPRVASRLAIQADLASGERLPLGWIMWNDSNDSKKNPSVCECLPVYVNICVCTLTCYACKHTCASMSMRKARICIKKEEK